MAVCFLFLYLSDLFFCLSDSFVIVLVSTQPSTYFISLSQTLAEFIIADIVYALLT